MPQKLQKGKKSQKRLAIQNKILILKSIKGNNFYFFPLLTMKITKLDQEITISLQRSDDVQIVCQWELFEGKLNDCKSAVTFEQRCLLWRKLNGFSMTSAQITELKDERMQEGKRKFEDGAIVEVTYDTDIAVWQHYLAWDVQVVHYIKNSDFNLSNLAIGELTIEKMKYNKKTKELHQTSSKYDDIMNDRGIYGD